MARRKAVPPILPTTYSRESTSETSDPKTDDESSSLPSVRTPSTLKATPRKRKTRRVSVPKNTEPPRDVLVDAITGVFGFIFGLIGDIFGTAIRLIRKPISIFLSLYVLAVILAWVYQFAQGPIYMALSPICKLPGVSFLDVPFCDFELNSGGRRGKRGGKTDFPKLINLQSNFDSILENSLGGSHMAAELKKSEIAVRDLSTLVRVSELLMCREELSARLDDFVQSAKSTSHGLSRFGSRVDGVVDSLLAMDEYALRALERARVSQIEFSSGNVITSWALAPFKPWNGYAEAEKDILSTFVQASNVMDNNIQRLIREAQMVLRDLDDLENRLEVIQEMVSREGGLIQKEHHEVLAQLWTFLGGNRKKIANFASHHTLLRGITDYRSKALHHVASSLIRLQQMQTDLEDLRDRVAEPGVLASTGREFQDIPLEVHIESIRKGLERLNTGRNKAKEIENDYMRKVIGMHDEAIHVLEMNAGPDA